MFLLHLSNVQICHMKSIVFMHPFFDFLVCGLCLCTCSINLIKINFYLNMIIRPLLGQKNSLDVRRYDSKYVKATFLPLPVSGNISTGIFLYMGTYLFKQAKECFNQIYTFSFFLFFPQALFHI